MKGWFYLGNDELLKAARKFREYDAFTLDASDCTLIPFVDYPELQVGDLVLVFVRGIEIVRGAVKNRRWDERGWVLDLSAPDRMSLGNVRDASKYFKMLQRENCNLVADGGFSKK